MSKYTVYYGGRKAMFKKMAVSWKAWSMSTELTETQSRGMRLFFKHVGKRFGLINEFKDIGVI